MTKKKILLKTKKKCDHWKKVRLQIVLLVVLIFAETSRVHLLIALARLGSLFNMIEIKRYHVGQIC